MQVHTTHTKSEIEYNALRPRRMVFGQSAQRQEDNTVIQKSNTTTLKR